MTNGNSAPTMELLIDGRTCAVTCTGKGRVEFSIKTGAGSVEAQKAMMTKIGATIRQIAFHGIPEGVLAQMAGTKARPNNFCRKLVQGVSTGDLSVWHNLNDRGISNMVEARGL